MLDDVADEPEVDVARSSASISPASSRQADGDRARAR
jgi:hypothetical protein